MNRREKLKLWLSVTAWQAREWCERVIYCHHNARVLADMEYRFGCVLCEATGGRMSKAYYDWPTMRDLIQQNVSESFNDGYIAGRRDLLEEQEHGGAP